MNSSYTGLIFRAVVYDAGTTLRTMKRGRGAISGESRNRSDEALNGIFWVLTHPTTQLIFGIRGYEAGAIGRAYFWSKRLVPWLPSGYRNPALLSFEGHHLVNFAQIIQVLPPSRAVYESILDPIKRTH